MSQYRKCKFQIIKIANKFLNKKEGELKAD